MSDKEEASQSKEKKKIFLSHELRQLSNIELKVGGKKPDLVDKELIGKWISVSYHRSGHGNCFDPCWVKDVKEDGTVTVSYPEEYCFKLLIDNYREGGDKIPSQEKEHHGEQWRMLRPIDGSKMSDQQRMDILQSKSSCASLPQL